MRFHLRTLFTAIALITAFLGGRASVLPLINEHEQQKALLEKELKSLVQLRPALSSEWDNEKYLREQWQAEKKFLEFQVRQAKQVRKSRLDGLLAFPINTEPAMLGDATSSDP